MDTKITVLNNDKINIDIIYHISDVHIKVNISEDLKQHYINLFDQISEQLSQEKKHFIVVITGDVIDTTYSAECIKMIHTFFNKLVQHCDVFYIKGNHCLSNKRNVDGQDMITPLISNYNEFSFKHRIYTLLNEGLYQYCNLIFGVTKMGSSEVFPCKIDKKFIKIGLHHGQVAHKNMNKIVKKQCMLDEKNFAKYYDVTLLGDCHSMTFLNDKKSVAYSGSLYEVNYREVGIDKGILKWDLKKKTADFIKIDGIIKHVILNVKNGKLENYDKKNLPCKVKFKIIYDGDTNFEKLEEIQKNLQSENNVLEILFEKSNDNNCLITDITMGDNKKKVNEIKTFDIVMKMIIDHIKENNKCDKQEINEIDDYLKKLSKNVSFNFFEKETTFRLKKLQFDNINSYGNDNVINFDLCSNKICEISGQNGLGKSTIITILLLGLYNECDMGTKYDCLNVKNIKNDAKIIIDFEVDSNTYQIKKIFNVRSHAKRECKEDLYLLKNGEDVTGRDNVETQKKINNLIGSYENMIDTNIVLQRNYKAFTDLSNNDKKRVIFKLSRLDVFDALAKHVRCELMSLQKKIPMVAKQIKDMLGNADESKIFIDTQNIKEEITKLKTEKNKLEEEYKEINKSKIELEFELRDFDKTKKIKNNMTLDDAKNKVDTLNKDIENKNICISKIKKTLNNNKFKNYEKKKKEFDEDLKLQLENLIEEKNKLLLKITNIDNFNEKKLSNQINEIQDKINKKREQIIDVEDDSIIKDYEKFKDLQKVNDTINLIIDKHEKDIKKYKNKQENMDEIMHDPCCKFCVVLKNKITFEENIQMLTTELENEKKKKKKNDNEIKKYGNCKEKYDNYVIAVEKNKKLENEIKFYTKDVDILKNEYEKNVMLQKHNTENNKKIKDLDDQIKKCKNKKLDHCDEYENLNRDMKNLLDEIDDMKDKIRDFNLIINNFEKISKIDKLDEVFLKHDTLTKKIRDVENEINAKNERLVENDVIIKQTIKLKEELENLKKEKQIVEYVNKSLDKDGIQDTILVKHIIPKLQIEVNNLLSMLSNFSIEIKYLNKTLQVYKIVNNKERILKLSGYEHMILGLCFRMVFCNLTHQQCKFVCFDEIFTFADDTAIQKIHYLFDYIRNHFEFALVISHNDSIKKYCDVSFDIMKENGFSKICIENDVNKFDDDFLEDEKPKKIQKKNLKL